MRIESIYFDAHALLKSSERPNYSERDLEGKAWRHLPLLVLSGGPARLTNDGGMSKALLDAYAVVHPRGKHGWARVHEIYNGTPDVNPRDLSSLKLK